MQWFKIEVTCDGSPIPTFYRKGEVDGAETIKQTLENESGDIRLCINVVPITPEKIMEEMPDEWAPNDNVAW